MDRVFGMAFGIDGVGSLRTLVGFRKHTALRTVNFLACLCTRQIGRIF